MLRYYALAILWLLIIWLMYEMLSDDRRAAVEVVLEERAAVRDPEHRDGNLPDLQRPEEGPQTTTDNWRVGFRRSNVTDDRRA